MEHRVCEAYICATWTAFFSRFSDTDSSSCRLCWVVMRLGVGGQLLIVCQPLQIVETLFRALQVLPNQQHLGRPSHGDAPRGPGTSAAGVEGGLEPRDAFSGKPDSPRSEAHKRAGVGGAFGVQRSDDARGGYLPGDERESPGRGQAGTMRDHRAGGDVGTMAQTHDGSGGFARLEGTSSGSSLSLTQSGWPPVDDARPEVKNADGAEDPKDNKRLFLSAPAGLNECGPLFSSSSSRASEEELETADLSAFLRSDSGKLESLQHQPIRVSDVPMPDTPFLTEKTEATASEPSTATHPSMSGAALWVWGLSYPDPARPGHAVAELHPAPEEEDPLWNSRSEDIVALGDEDVDEDDKLFLAPGSQEGLEFRAASPGHRGSYHHIVARRPKPGEQRASDAENDSFGVSPVDEQNWVAASVERGQRGPLVVENDDILVSGCANLGSVSEDEGREKRKKSFKRLSKLIVGMRRLLPAADCMHPNSGMKLCASRGSSLSFRVRNVDSVGVIRELPLDEPFRGDSDVAGDMEAVEDDGMEQTSEAEDLDAGSRGDSGSISPVFSKSYHMRTVSITEHVTPANDVEGPLQVLKDPVSLDAGLAASGHRRSGSGREPTPRDLRSPMSEADGTEKGASAGHQIPNSAYMESVDSIWNTALEQGLNRQGDLRAVGAPNGAREGSWGFAGSVSLPVNDLGDGRYLVSGHLVGCGEYQVSVKIGGRHVQGSPAIVEVW